MSSSRIALSAIAALVGVVACARIAGLDESGGAAAASSGDAGSQTTLEGAVIRPDQLSILAGCGTRADSEGQITIENDGSDGLEYSLESSDPTLLGFVSSSGTVVPTVSGKLDSNKVSPGVKVSVTSSAPGKHSATVLVTVGASQRIIPVDLTVQGGTLSLSPSSVLAFGQVRQNTASTLNIAVKNTGTTPVTIDGWDGTTGDFTMPTGSVTIDPDGTQSVTATLTGGPAGVEVSTTITPHVAEGLCGGSPSVRLAGTRVNTSVTVTGAVDFGQVDCGGAPTKPMVVSNFSTTRAAHYKFQLDGSSFYTVDPDDQDVPTGTTVAPGQATVNLRMKPQSTPGDHTESLSVVTSGDDTSTKTVSVTTSIRGGIIAITPTTIDFDKKSQTKSFKITNTGNEFVYVGFSASGGFTVDDRTPVPTNVGLGINVKSPPGPGNYSGIVTIRRIDTPFLDQLVFGDSRALCNNPVPTVTLTGSGH